MFHSENGTYPDKYQIQICNLFVSRPTHRQLCFSSDSSLTRPTTTSASRTTHLTRPPNAPSARTFSFSLTSYIRDRFPRAFHSTMNRTRPTNKQPPTTCICHCAFKDCFFLIFVRTTSYTQTLACICKNR